MVTDDKYTHNWLHRIVQVYSNKIVSRDSLQKRIILFNFLYLNLITSNSLAQSIHTSLQCGYNVCIITKARKKSTNLLESNKSNKNAQWYGRTATGYTRQIKVHDIFYLK